VWGIFVGKGLQSSDEASISPSEGRLAQLVERFVYTEDVGGSSPSSPTTLCPFGLRLARPPSSRFVLSHTFAKECIVGGADFGGFVVVKEGQEGVAAAVGDF
jgi:hypothetical protein